MPAKPLKKPAAPKVVGLAWRDGRPRWIPSPTLRERGWRGMDLRDEHDVWLTYGAACDKAIFINEGVAAWRARRAIPDALAAIAPAAAGTVSSAAPHPLGARTIGRLVDEFDETPRPLQKTLRASTKKHYRSMLRTLLRTCAALQGKKGISVEQLRAMDVGFFVEPKRAGERFWLQEAYDHLDKHTGHATAFKVITAADIWFEWVIRRKKMLALNPANAVDREPVKGRKVLVTEAESDAWVAAADWLGWPSIGDAIVLALDLAWNRQDVLALRWDQIDDAYRVAHTRLKTGVEGKPRLMPAGRERLAQIRQRWEGRIPATIVATDARKPWGDCNFSRCFELVRAAASAEAGPQSLGKTFQDLRDTGITNIARVPNTSPQEIATRSLHSLESVTRILQEHYLVLDQPIADAASDKLEAYLLAQRKKPPVANDSDADKEQVLRKTIKAAT